MNNIIILTKNCTRCEKKLFITLEYFCRDKRKKDGFCSECKACHNKQMKQHYKNHREKLLNKVKQYYKTINGHLHHVFTDINRRCNNPKNLAYKNYGGRGIQNKFKNVDGFINYILNELQIDPRGLTIDRINTNGHYEPGNIRFITQAENNKNRRKRNA